MERLSIQSNLFEDSEDSSLPLLTTSNRLVSARPTCVYITIGSDKCFKVFENRFSKGLGTLRLSEMMDEIRGTGVFKNLVQIISDVSGDLSSESKKENFFFGSRYNLKIMWEYCTLSKIDMDENPGILDDSDRMRIEDFNSLMNFYLKTSTLKVVDEEVIMELFAYFINRDMILTASLMQFDTSIQEPEQTLLQIEEEEIHNAWLHLVIWISTFLRKQNYFSETIKEENPRMFGLNSLPLNQTALICLN